MNETETQLRDALNLDEYDITISEEPLPRGVAGATDLHTGDISLDPTTDTYTNNIDQVLDHEYVHAHVVNDMNNSNHTYTTMERIASRPIQEGWADMYSGTDAYPLSQTIADGFMDTVRDDGAAAGAAYLAEAWHFLEDMESPAVHTKKTRGADFHSGDVVEWCWAMYTPPPITDPWHPTDYITAELAEDLFEIGRRLEESLDKAEDAMYNTTVTEPGIAQEWVDDLMNGEYSNET